MPKRTKGQTQLPARTVLGLSSGCSVLNLACTGSIEFAFPVGKIYNIVGDKSTGKSFLGLTALAEAASNPAFAEYELFYDDAEEANEFDLPHLFGTTAARFESPSRDDSGPIFSETIEDFEDFIHAKLDTGNPFVYVLDSLDSLTTEDEQDHTFKTVKAHRKGKTIEGSYDLSKQKRMSKLLRLINGRLKESQSILIVISQTRDVIDAFSFSKKYRAGGRALDFYSSIDIWLAVCETLTKLARGSRRQIGIRTKAKVNKNKVTGKVRNAEFPILYEYGIDDIGSMIAYLIIEQHWSKEKSGIVNAPEFDHKGRIADLVKVIESDPTGIKALRTIVADVWAEIEAQIKPNRRQRYQ